MKRGHRNDRSKVSGVCPCDRAHGLSATALLLGLVSGSLAAQPLGSSGRAVRPLRPVPLCRPLVLEGEVHRGQPAFHHPIGHGLEIAVEPVPGGWVVRVWPVAGRRPANDLAELATPPYRSVSPLLLTTDFGFRAQDVLGWNPRHFEYLRDAAAVPAAEHAYTAVLSGPHPTRAQEAAVTQAIQHSAEGQLTILDAAIVPGSADQNRAAATVATHLETTPHSTVPGTPSALGSVEGLRFRLSLASSAPGGEPCQETSR